MTEQWAALEGGAAAALSWRAEGCHVTRHLLVTNIISNVIKPAPSPQTPA